MNKELTRILLVLAAVILAIWGFDELRKKFPVPSRSYVSRNMTVIGKHPGKPDTLLMIDNISKDTSYMAVPHDVYDQIVVADTLDYMQAVRN